MRLYRQTWLGKKLAGWVDDNGHTYKTSWPFGHSRQPNWSVDEQGSIYIEAGGYRAFIGWLGENGSVYAQYGRPSSGFFGYPESSRLLQPSMQFSPVVVFQVTSDGNIYSQHQRRIKIIGKVEGAPDLYTIAGLALVLLL